jgi:hypothetical protein
MGIGHGYGSGGVQGDSGVHAGENRQCADGEMGLQNFSLKFDFPLSLNIIYLRRLLFAAPMFRHRRRRFAAGMRSLFLFYLYI